LHIEGSLEKKLLKVYNHTHSEIGMEF